MPQPDRGYVPGHGDRRYAVRHYDLDLTYKVPTNHLAATATLTVRALEPLHELAIDLAGLHVAKVTVDGRLPARHTHRAGRLVVRLREERRAGAEFVVRIAYSGKPGPLDCWTARRFAGNNLTFGNVSGTGKSWTGSRYWTN